MSSLGFDILVHITRSILSIPTLVFNFCKFLFVATAYSLTNTLCCSFELFFPAVYEDTFLVICCTFTFAFNSWYVPYIYSMLFLFYQSFLIFSVPYGHISACAPQGIFPFTRCGVLVYVSPFRGIIGICSTCKKVTPSRLLAFFGEEICRTSLL